MLLVVVKTVLVITKCVECSLWPSDVFGKCVKHRSALISKSRSKESCKDSSGAVPCKSLVIEGQGDQGYVNNSIPTSGISKDKVKSFICNHTFPVYLISTTLIPAETADMHTDIEKRRFSPLTTLPLSLVVS